MIPMVRVLQVMRRVLPPLVLPTVRVLLRMVVLMPTARALHRVGGVDGEAAVGDASGVVVAGDADGEGVAGDAAGDAVGEGALGGAPCVGVAGNADGEGVAGDAAGVGAAGVALIVRVLQGMLQLAVSLVITTVRVLRVMVLGVGPRHSWRRAW